MQKNFLFYITFLFFIKFFAQYQNVYQLKYVQDKSADFYHLNLIKNTEQNSIPFIAQDSTGQMWFATKDGLIRYDTKKFYTYKFEPENPHSIGGNFVERILVGHDGVIFVGTEPGLLAKYRPQTNDFVRINGISGKRIKDIKQDTGGLYWITTEKKLYRYNDQTSELKTFSYSDNKTGMDRLLITRDGRFFITTNEHYILEFFPAENRFEKINIIPENEKIHTSNTVFYSAFYLVEDKAHYIWITTPYGYLVRYNPQDGSKVKYVFKSLKDTDLLDRKKLTVMFVFEDSEGQLWFGTWFNGMYKIDRNRQKITHYLPDENNPNSLTNNIIHSGFQDKAGYLWFGTEFAGINILKKNKKFDIINYQNPNFPDAFNASTTDNQGNVWIADYEKGMYMFPKFQPGKIRCLNDFFGFQAPPQLFFDIYHTADNTLYISTNKGMYVYNRNRNTYEVLQYHKENFNSLTSNAIIDIEEDRNHRIWIGTNYGLNRYDPKTGKILRFMYNENNPNGLSNNFIHKVYCDSQNHIWIGTRGGLNLWEPATGNFIAYRHDDNVSNSLPDNIIYDIAQAGGYLWLATRSGLVRFDTQNKQQFRLFTTDDGLPENYIRSLITDDNGRLWAATSHYLIKVSPDDFHLFVYSKSDGLEGQNFIKNVGRQNFEFATGNAYKDPQGYLYFGGLAGMTVFHPDSLPVNTYQAPVYLTKFEAEGKELIPSGKITLSPHQNTFTVETNILNYIQPDKNTYAFYLENYDTVWQNTGNRNTITYYNVPGGNYQLHFKAANNDQVWTNSDNVVKIRIRLPFYRTRLFYSMIILLVLMLISAFYLHKIYIKRKIERQRKMLEYSTSSLSEKEIERIDKLLSEKLQSSKMYLEPNLSLHKLAKEIGVIPNHLSQTINQKHGRNFNDYINLYRLQDALKLLKKTQLKIEAVAYDSGFNSLSTFNTFFKKEKKMTPSAYRRKYRSEGMKK